MKKFALALALGTGLTVTGIASPARADTIQSLAPTSLSASTFNSLFQPISSSPEMSSPFTYLGLAPNVSGTIESQVFQGTGAYAGLYAYAYQVDVNKTTDSSGNPVNFQSASFKFDATPVGSDLTNLGHTSYVYTVTNGTVGGLSLPTAAPGQSILSPASLNWEPNTSGGSILASFVNSATGVPALNAGGNSATFILLSDSPPSQQFVNVQSPNPVDPTSLTSVYAPTGGTPQPVPIPEPATLLGWVGALGIAAAVRRVRKSRPAAK
ncbi:MAG: hypothetical protein P4L84_25760 [Isosphaeraceae bacterium]|nr:hypothetical protein [Isosphaeraceae bacterium]